MAHQQERQAAQLDAAIQETQISLRSAFSMLAADAASQTRFAFDQYLASTYDAALEFIDERATTLVSTRAGADELIDRLTEHGRSLKNFSGASGLRESWSGAAPPPAVLAGLGTTTE